MYSSAQGKVPPQPSPPEACVLICFRFGDDSISTVLSPQLTPAEKGGLSDFSSEPALYF